MTGSGFLTSIQHFLHEELSGWTKKEVAWLLIACLSITVLSLVLGDSAFGVACAVSGILCVVLTGKGKLSAFIFGIINVVFYAVIAFQATYYGEAFENLLFRLPMEFVGIYVWSRHMNPETHEVNKRHMRNRTRFLVLGGIIALTVLLYLVIGLTNDAMPITDCFTSAATVIGMIVAIGMFSEQWWIWIGVNILTIFMWIQNILAGSSNVATLCMWVVYLINSIIMCVKWEKEVKANSKKERII